jgi:Right handed beta helix region
LTIDGAGVGQTGILFNTGASLTVENCVIRHMTEEGIGVFSTTSSALTVSYSLVADNVGTGIVFTPSGSATAVFNRVEVNNNAGLGIFVNGSASASADTINVTVSDRRRQQPKRVRSRNAPGHAPTSLMLFHSVAANNGIGVEAQNTGATLRLAILQ